jgi:hypothetical protein
VRELVYQPVLFARTHNLLRSWPPNLIVNLECEFDIRRIAEVFDQAEEPREDERVLETLACACGLVRRRGVRGVAEETDLVFIVRRRVLVVPY